MPLFDFFFFKYFFFSYFILSLNLGKNLPDSRFIPGFGGGYVPNNSNDVTNPTSAAAVAAIFSNKSIVSIPTNRALSGMCYYFTLTL